MKVTIYPDDNGAPCVEISATARTFSHDALEELVQWAHILYRWCAEERVEVQE